MGLQAVAGSKIYIGTKVAKKLRVTLSDFSAQEAHWTEIKGWAQSGSLGDTQQIISQPIIDEDRDDQIKGTRSGAAMENTFVPDANDPGQIKFAAATNDCSNFAFKVAWGASCASEGKVTISVADPAVITWPEGHGLEAGSPVMFTPDGGNLPTGLSPDTLYFVVEAGLSPTEFSVAATKGGAAIETTVAATATSITATAQPAGQTDLFFGLAMPGAKQGGAANTAQLRNWSIVPTSNIVEV